MTGPAAAPVARGELALVYGAVRSGTTMLRLMLDTHSRLVCPGESDWLFDHLVPDGDGGWRYDRAGLEADRIFLAAGIAFPEELDGPDALAEMLVRLQGGAPGRLVLMLHRHLERALALLPGAPVLHLVRDPRDVARSCIGRGWAGNVYHGIEHWMLTETAWKHAAARLAAHPVLEMRYEQLVGDPPAALSRAAAFLGERFEPAMLAYHRDNSYAAPDPALTAQWRRHLSGREIGLVEGRAGALLAARGYDPSGHPPIHPGRLARAGLWLDNRAGAWRTRIARFGLVDPVLFGLAKRLGLWQLQRRMQRRLDAKKTAQLK